MSFVLLLIILSASEAILQVPTIAPTPPRLTATANSDYMTESRYNFLLDLIIQERQSRNNLEKEVLELRTRLQTAEQESSDSRRNLTFELNLTTTNCIASLDTATKRYDFLLKDHESLKMDYDNVFNKTVKLEEQLRTLDVSRITSIFNNFSAIENKLYTLEKNIAGAYKSINIIMSERKARQQDFLALINITRQTSQRLANNEHVMTTQFGQLRTSQKSIEQDIAAFHIDIQKNVSELEMHFANRMDILEKNTNSISSKMQLSLAELSKSSEKGN
jgi:septal ring factor EnvC (AmiA/AmiB activator)